MPYIPMEYTVDLGKTINVTPLHTLFAMGDDNAHRFSFSIVQDGKPVDLSGCTVLATYTNFSPNGVTVNLEGKIEDGKAVALLGKACYTMEGRFALVVRLKNSDGTSAIFYGDGYMSRTTSDTVIDGDYIIYDLNTLLEKIKEINEATSRANTAAETANSAASSANTEAQNANTAANAANASAQTANAAAAKINDMTVSATPVDTGTATAELSTVDGHYHLSLGLPKGDTGATPRISVQVQTGAAGSEASVSVSGTAEEPVIHLTIPRGDTGAIENMTINGKPVESGTITLTPEDLGAASVQEVSQLKNDIGDAWVSGKTYAVGDYCISGNQLYKCKTAHTSGSAFDAAYWGKANVSSEISSVKNAIESNYPIGPGLEIVTGNTDEKKTIIFNLRDNARDGLVAIFGRNFLASVYIHTNGSYEPHCDNPNVAITKLSATSFAVNAGMWNKFYAICTQNTFELTYGD